MMCRATTSAHTCAPSRVKRGFTLVETLLSLMILVLLTGIVAMGVPAAWSAYTKAVDGSNAQVLLTTASSLLRDELGMAQQVDPNSGGASITYVTGAGHWATIYVDNDGPTPRIQKQVYTGTVVFDESGASTYHDWDPIEGQTSFLSDAAITDSFGITYESISYDPSQGIFTVEGLKVVDASGNTLTSAGDGTSDEFKIRAIR